MDICFRVRVHAFLLLLLFISPIGFKSPMRAMESTDAIVPKRELRAVWVTTLGGLDWPRTKATSAATCAQQQRELCQLLDQLKAAGINTVLLQTRVRGSVIYPSAIEPWDVALTGSFDKDPGYDPLRFAIEEAHRRGMELHAWVVTIPAFKQAVAKQMGKRGLLKTHPDLLRKHADMYYLDPGLPATADYLLRICHEIVSRYDVDGLHFDYIRYPENAASFNDAATFRRYAAKGVSKAAWRRDNITRIVRRIYEDVKAVKPWVRVSSSPVGKYADVSRFPSRGWNARDAVHQDAEGWLRMGIHDILFPMMYFDGNHFYPFAADWQEQSFGRYVAPGLGIYFMHPNEKNWPLAVIERQLHYLREQGLAGQCYFRSKFLMDNVKGLYDYLRNDFYAFPALPPACTWLDHVAPSVPTRAESAEGTLAWLPSSDNMGGGVRYNVYASREWPVDVNCAKNLVATQLPTTHFAYNRTASVGYYFAVTAIDRCGNESGAMQCSSHPAERKVGPSRLQLTPDGHVRGLIERPLTTVERKQKEKEAKKAAKKRKR